MKAAVLHELSKAPRFEDFAEPTPGNNEEALIRVRAASLKSVDKQLASGSHYASPRQLPVICGTDGLGILEDGTRVFFGGPWRRAHSAPPCPASSMMRPQPRCPIRVFLPGCR